MRATSPPLSSRTRTKHIVPPSTKHATKKIGAIGAMPLHHYLSKLEAGGGGGGRIQGLGPAAPPPRESNTTICSGRLPSP